MTLKRVRTDILILGSGGAGLFAALHAHDANPELSITVAVNMQCHSARRASATFTPAGITYGF